MYNVKKRSRMHTLIALLVAVLLFLIATVWISFDRLFWRRGEYNRLISTEGIYDIHLSERSLTVPDLCGQIYTGADMANAAGTDDFYVVVAHEYEDDSPEGTILEQLPPANTKRKRSNGKRCAVEVAVSTGHPTLPLPELSGKDVRDATIQLESMGLAVCTKNVLSSASPSSSSRCGKIRFTSPPAQSPVKIGDKITLYIADNSEGGSVKCPDLQGMYRIDAMSALHACGLEIGEISQDTDIPFYCFGKVVLQSRIPNTYVKIGTKIDITLDDTGCDLPLLDGIDNQKKHTGTSTGRKWFWFGSKQLKERSFKWYTNKLEE